MQSRPAQAGLIWCTRIFSWLVKDFMWISKGVSHFLFLLLISFRFESLNVFFSFLTHSVLCALARSLSQLAFVYVSSKCLFWRRWIKNDLLTISIPHSDCCMRIFSIYKYTRMRYAVYDPIESSEVEEAKSEAKRNEITCKSRPNFKMFVRIFLFCVCVSCKFAKSIKFYQWWWSACG